MIIQHNISALNSYNKLAGNNNRLAKNLEKLSSGYKINRAADNAAGLAISEKMRAQITGLETCQQNSKDGISLVQTAEGALTEVHSMLNRMVALTTQASNGIYEDGERQKIQDELDQLNEEIDRIADATNFNGIKLLDGSMGTGGSGGAGTINTSLTTTKVDAVAGSYTADAAITNTNTGAIGSKSTFTFTFSDGSSASFEVEAVKNGANADLYIDGEKIKAGTATTVAAQDIADGLKAKLEEKYGDKFTFDTTGAKMTATAKEAGADSLQMTGFIVNGTKANGDLITESFKAATAGATVGTNTVIAADEKTKIAAADITEYDGTGDIEDSVFTINGKKFIVAKNDQDLTGLASDVNVLQYNTSKTTGTDLEAMAKELTHSLGINVKADGTTGFIFEAAAGDGKAAGGGSLRLQIGETNDDFNMLDVTVEDCHADAIGVGLANMRVDDVNTANKAMMDAKEAIEYVSAVRSRLGAIQNRLDHTLANLEETTTNLTEAESRIRDTDMAQEMMKYTKNNILIQSSQAMLAQANQVPQGVLQLLQ